MLTMPNTPHPLTVMGLDPGTTTLGVAILQWGFVTPPRFQVRHAFTITANENDPNYRAMAEVHGDRFARLQQQHDMVLSILHQFHPHCVISEAPFKGKFVQSFAALTECVFAIRQSVLNYDPQLPLNMIEPRSVKLNAGVNLSRKNDKEDVRQALANRSDLEWFVDLQTLDEHSVDAIAVALYYLTTQV